ncbi:MAG TPA: AHH domain-containing protein [Myxococcaceae bacterium]|nr:AHH domain-containing protein [Myxococcaceae bacterium]
MEGALVVLRAEGLRPVVRTLGDRSYGENSLDAIEAQVAQAVDLLNPEQVDDVDRRRAAAVAIEFASLECDAVAADVQAVQRGMRLVARRPSNRVVQYANEVRIAMAQDWRWSLDHKAQVEESIEKARAFRDMIFEWAPWAPVMKAGVAAANFTQLYVSVGQLLVNAPAALERVTAWLRGPGSGGAQFALAGEGGTLAVQLVAESGAIVLTEAELTALVQAGQVSRLALQLIYLARGHLHHIATDKNWISDASGGPWSPIFDEIFKDANLSFDDPANLVEVEGHVGPHPEAYHEQVLRELSDAKRGLQPGTPAFREAIIRALRDLGKRIQTPGTRLNQLVTGAARG